MNHQRFAREQTELLDAALQDGHVCWVSVLRRAEHLAEIAHSAIWEMSQTKDCGLARQNRCTCGGICVASKRIEDPTGFAV